MRVRIRLFARLSDLTGVRDTYLEMDGQATAAQVFQRLAQEYPALAGLGGSLMYAVNAEYVPPDQLVQEGDEVTFIPPVSGGAHAGRNHR